MQIKNQKQIYLQQVDKEFPKAEQEAQKREKLKLLDHLESIEAEYGGKSVRATLVQFGKVNTDNFDPQVKKVLRKNCLVECSYLIKTNWNATREGKWYELDQEATDKNIKDHEEWLEKNKEAAALEAEVGAEVANTIKAIGKVAKEKVKGPRK